MDTTVKILGCHFENPILPASGPLVEGLENLVSLHGLPLGGLVTKTISVHGAQVNKPCIIGTKHMIYNTELWSEHDLAYWVDALKAFSVGDSERGLPARKKPLGISVGYTAEDFKVCVPLLSPYADFFEVSTHYHKEALEEVVKTMVSLTDKPVLIKLSPHVQEDLNFVETVLNCGGAGVVALNSFGPGLALDLKKRSVLIGNGDGHSWVSGPAIKPFVLQRIARLREYFPHMTLVGCGGVDTSEDVLEMVLAGADLVQVLSSAMLYGREHYSRLAKGLLPAMKVNGIDSMESLRSSGFSKVPQGMGSYPVTDPQRCTRCQKCVRVCPFEAYGHIAEAAIVSKERVPMVHQKRCIRCGLCESLCPVGAISGVLR
jgi:dihydroorotate dehydrogenase/NAD-dependent dihydropyrimidine dehydrogenase PreA subunit